jgi:peptidoglycan hydrolase-like protein with peptidoglycan-binding domain
MLLKKGSTGEDVKRLQRVLGLPADGVFGPNTEASLKKWQAANGLAADGIAGDKTLSKMGITAASPASGSSPKPAASSSDPANDQTWKDKVIEGSTFPGKPYSSSIAVKLNPDMVNIYVPALNRAFPTAPKGLKLLLTIMAYHEGFKQGSRSFRTNNPGNVGNVDSGANQTLKTLEDGIRLQYSYIEGIVNGKNKYYPMNQPVYIKPYYSQEIAQNAKSYQMSPWLPGYKFTFTGQLDQFVKIYSTGARGGNSYINTIVSYFTANGLPIKPDSKIQDIIAMQ